MKRTLLSGLTLFLLCECTSSLKWWCRRSDNAECEGEGCVRHFEPAQEKDGLLPTATSLPSDVPSMSPTLRMEEIAAPTVAPTDSSHSTLQENEVFKDNSLEEGAGVSAENEAVVESDVSSSERRIEGNLNGGLGTASYMAMAFGGLFVLASAAYYYRRSKKSGNTDNMSSSAAGMSYFTDTVV